MNLQNTKDEEDTVHAILARFGLDSGLMTALTKSEFNAVNFLVAGLIRYTSLFSENRDIKNINPYTVYFLLKLSYKPRGINNEP